MICSITPFFKTEKKKFFYSQRQHQEKKLMHNTLFFMILLISFIVSLKTEVSRSSFSSRVIALMNPVMKMYWYGTILLPTSISLVGRGSVLLEAVVVDVKVVFMLVGFFYWAGAVVLVGVGSMKL